MAEPIKPVFDLSNLPKPVGKKNTPSPKLTAKTGKKQEQSQPDWLVDTPPTGDGEVITLGPDEVEMLEPEGRAGEQRGQALEPIDYKRGGPQTTPDIERQVEILTAAIERGESVPVIAKRYGVSRQAIQHYISQAKEELEVNSQVLDIKLVQMFGDKMQQIVLALDKDKMDKATVRDLAIAAGIFADKRKELLGPRSGSGNLHLRAVFRGEGAIEVRTGD